MVQFFSGIVQIGWVVVVVSVVKTVDVDSVYLVVVWGAVVHDLVVVVDAAGVEVVHLSVDVEGMVVHCLVVVEGAPVVVASQGLQQMIKSSSLIDSGTVSQFGSADEQFKSATWH